jgi:hypothetical protein
MNYITRTVGNVTLYFDGEQFQQHKSAAKRYTWHEGMFLIITKKLTFAILTPIDEGWRQVNDEAFNMLRL